MYKLVALDFDGTLLNGYKKVDYNTLDILRKLKKMGIIIVALTARNFNSVCSVVDIGVFNYLLINNGASLYDVDNKKFYSYSVLDRNTFFDIVNFMKPLSKKILMISDFYYYLLSDNSSKSSYIKYITSLEDIKDEVVRINIILNDGDIYYYNNLLADKFNDINCFVMRDSEEGESKISVNVLGVNKKTGLEKLGNILNIKLEEMVFFGDSMNDIEAIESVGLGVAMGNALDEVKCKAKFVTSSNNEEGIYKFLNKLYFE